VDAAGGTLGDVQHGAQVAMAFALPEMMAAALVAKLNEAGHGQVLWIKDEDAAQDRVAGALGQRGASP
jgi:hypothetical protein